MQSNIKNLRSRIDTFPRSPGVYIMKDREGRMLYIGKAIDVRGRLKTYFDNQDERHQIPALLARVKNIEWIATSSESEALILEANLVRKHKPRYNIDLKDDKHYPYLKVTLNEKFPRLIVVRRIHKDGGRYFGPYTDATTMRRVMALAKKAFKICDCKRILNPRPNPRPCINYSIGRCCAACAGKISEQDYAGNIALLMKFLAGRRIEVIDELKQEMEKASAILAYEKAAAIRDQIAFIKSGAQLQKVDMKAERVDRDVFGAWDDGRYLCLCVLSFRQGLLLSKRHFLFTRRNWQYSLGNRERLILQFYQDAAGDPPGEIIVGPDMDIDRGLLQLWFSTQFTNTIDVRVPQKGQKLDLVDMAKENARLYLMQKAPPDSRADVRMLKAKLNLPRYPRIIEAFDISNLGESFTVGGMVRFTDAVPDKNHYRRFKIKSVAGQNDFAMLLETVSRRCARLAEEKEPFADLLLIDGGKGQLRAAMKALDTYENPPMIISLAKKEELLFSPYVPRAIRLPENDPARKLVQRIRDEVHRFAITYHRKIRDRQFSRSSLQDIPGVGPKKAKLLLKKFGSIQRVRNAAVEELAAVKGFSLAMAQGVKERLKA